MRGSILIRLRHWLPAIVVMASVAMALGFVGSARAGIIAPQQVDFSAKDLAKSLEEGAGAGGTSSAAPSHDSRRLPFPGEQTPADPLSLQNSHQPMGGNTSSSSSNATSGSVSFGAVCLLDGTLTHRDDAELGRLSEDHGLSLPDPPGTDLLRPPRR